MKDGSFITGLFIVFIVAILAMFIYDTIMMKHKLEDVVIKQQQTIESQSRAIRQMELLMLMQQSSPKKFN